MHNLYKPNIIIAKDRDDMSRQAAGMFVQTYKESIINRKQKHFTVAVPGGASPEKFFRVLAGPEYGKEVNWRQVHVFWTDERAVNPSSSESNFLLAWGNWLKPANVPEANIHRIRGKAIFPKFEAWRYTMVLKKFLGNGGAFDLLVLGMGTDGHTMSIFPDSELAFSKRWGGVSVLTPKGLRYTLTPEMVRKAKKIVALTPGKAKRELLYKLLEGDYTSREYPILLIKENPNTVVVTTLTSLL